MVKNFLNTFRRTLLMLARRGVNLNLSIYSTTQNDIDNFKSWMESKDDEYSDKVELLNAHNRGVDITGYIPFFMMNDEEFENLYTKMKSDRNSWTFEYNIMKGEKGNSEIDDKNIYYSFLYQKGPEINNYCFVYFADENGKSSIGNEIVKHCISTTSVMKEKKIPDSDFNIQIDDIIIILSKPLSTQAKKTLNDVNRNNPYNINIFEENEISTDPFDNIWNSEINIYTEEESKNFMRKNNLMINQLPRRPISDIQLKYLGCPENRIIELKRFSYIPESIIRTELTHAYTYYKNEEKPRTVAKKQTSDFN
jgi:DNA-directed RNA polymerase subunit H (RpoH/RPB5)